MKQELVEMIEAELQLIGVPLQLIRGSVKIFV